MTAAARDPRIVARPPAGKLALRAADQGVASALESVLSDNTRRVYGAHVVHFTAAVYSGVGGRVGGFGFQDALH